MEENPVQHHRLRVSNPEELVEAIRGAHLDVRLLAVKAGDSSLERIFLPRICFDAAHLTSPTLVYGEMPADCFTLIYVRKCPQNGHSFNFSTQHRDGYMGFFPPGGVIDAMTPAAYANATLTIPEALLLEKISHRFPEIPDGWLEHGTALRVPAAAQGKLATLLAARNELDRRDPAWLMNGAACRHFEEDLMEAFLDAMRDSYLAGLPTASKPQLRRYEAIRRIREHISENRGVPLHLDDLCVASGMSRRWLEYAFKDLFGVGANGFVRYQRLHGARQELLLSEPVSGLVKKVALEWGFWHFGRFSAEYRSLFGESPNRTPSRRYAAR